MSNSKGRRAIVVGGGIVGSAVAQELAGRGHCNVMLLEQGPHSALIGSTGHAPGYVGVLNDVELMTTLALTTIRKAKRAEHGGLSGASTVGNVEVATTADGMTELVKRAELARSRGLDAYELSVDGLEKLAPDFISRDRCAGGVYYPGDGTARADVITLHARLAAKAAGAQIICDKRVCEIVTRSGRAVAVRTIDGHIYEADDIVLACGIWASELGRTVDLAISVSPVAHPYVYGPKRPVSRRDQPFVRWPTEHAYSRDHDGRIGLGSYDHATIGVDVDDLGLSAEKPWTSEFDAPVGRAIGLLPVSSRFTPEIKLNGVFSMTPDNLPLVGRTNVAGLWLAEAIWVTHSLGCAEFVADLIDGTDRPAAEVGLLNPMRFAGIDTRLLQSRALRLYNDIYSAKEAEPSRLTPSSRST